MHVVLHLHWTKALHLFAAVVNMTVAISEIATISYAILQTVGILSTAVYVWFSVEGSTTHRLKQVWRMRFIYTSTLATIYDQATDIGVIIYWYDLMILEQNGEDIQHIDMRLFFWICLAFLSLSRVLNVVFFGVFCRGSVNLDTENPCLGVLLGLFDLLTTYQVWTGVIENFDKSNTNINTNTNNNDNSNNKVDSSSSSTGFQLENADFSETNEKIALIQLFEVVFESIPQSILQGVFLIRSNNDDVIKSYNGNDENSNNDAFSLVIISLFFSVISATNKYIKFNNERYLHLRRKCPIMHIGYLMYGFWYYCNIISRLFLFILLWSIVGGIFVFVFAFISFIGYLIGYFCNIYSSDEDKIFDILRQFWLEHILGYIDLSDKQDIPHFLHHCVENVLLFGVILFFTFDNSFECDHQNIIKCADPDTRYINGKNGGIIAVFVITCGITIVMDMVAYFLYPLCDEWGDAKEQEYQASKA